QPPEPTPPARFLSGECTPPERLAVEQWLRENPAHQQELTVLAAAWARPGEAAEAKPDLDVGRFWQQIRERIDVPGPPSITVVKPAGPAPRAPAFAFQGPSRWLTARRAAASIA